MYNNNMFTHLYRFADKFVKIIAFFFIGAIAVCSLYFTAHNYEMTGHYFDIRKDNVLINIGWCAVVFIVGFFIYRFLLKNLQKRLKVFSWITIAFSFFACEYMAFFGRSMPNSDSWIVYAMAKQMAVGDLSIIHPTGSYMSYYPQQIGICAFLSLMIRIIDIFPVAFEEFHIIMALYGIMECATVYFLYKTVDELWSNSKANFAFLYLSVFNLPFIMYSSYLYGEVPALMFISFGAFGLTRLINEKGKVIINVCVSIVSFILSVFVRKNSLIIVIAALIVLFFEALFQRRAMLLFTGLAIAIGAFSVLPITVRYYENKSGSTLTTGVTALSYVAMGMDEPMDGINPGWYTAFNIDAFEESGCNPKIANEISRAHIEERFDYFKNNPKVMKDFYKSKFLTQWTDGTYFSAESTHVYYGDRSDFLMEVYYGDYRASYIYLCNVFQDLIFIGAFLWAVSGLLSFKRDGFSEAFLFIGVFGGFLFHMIWEANSRYIITYACLLIPYAAIGYASLFSGLGRKWKR